MASLNTNITGTNVLSQLGQNLRSFGNGVLNLLVLIAEFTPRYRAIQYYNALSDEELAEMGMTRADVVQKVFGARMYL
ncbi:DUF1127 domain-containing protein [Natronohydrobacter thiooxidans]|jgi:uncharacterized protein YjiS (DUF1127 family)|uniref:DUF1127 domain-containing protein n=1 Tax=Natronohydrobacter thiooxidans TaxID=87172 RepID=UPI0008FF756A|nr:DUF1127 domain-containing protein [Natronohydrobacter thiooxidans]